jgi:hypothetical protein
VDDGNAQEVEGDDGGPAMVARGMEGGDSKQMEGWQRFDLWRGEEKGKQKKENRRFMNPPIFVGPTNIGRSYPSAMHPLYSSMRPHHRRI